MTEHTIATALVKSQKAHKRKAADFYPTPFDVTQALLDFLQLPPGTYIWEPACGDGSMSAVLKAAGHEVYSTDLREDSGYGEEGGLDFLKYDAAPPSGIPIGAVFNEWIITNPPFNLAEDFIRKSLSITGNVAMLLSNQYWHAERRRDLFSAHTPAFVLPLTWRPAFLEAERGKSPMMNVFWVVWREGHDGCRYLPLPRPRNLPEIILDKAVQKRDDPFADLLGGDTIDDDSIFGDLI